MSHSLTAHVRTRGLWAGETPPRHDSTECPTANRFIPFLRLFERAYRPDYLHHQHFWSHREAAIRCPECPNGFWTHPRASVSEVSGVSGLEVSGVSGVSNGVRWCPGCPSCPVRCPVWCLRVSVGVRFSVGAPSMTCGGTWHSALWLTDTQGADLFPAARFDDICKKSPKNQSTRYALDLLSKVLKPLGTAG